MNYQFESDSFLEYLEKLVSYQHAEFSKMTTTELKQYLENKRSQIYQLLKIDELKTLLREPVKSEKITSFESDGIEVAKYAVKGIKALDTPLYIAGENNPPSRSLLYLQGHHPAGAYGCIKIENDTPPFHKYLPLLLAKNGFRVYVPELLAFGEARRKHYNRAGRDDSECLANEIVLVSCGFSLAGFRTMQTMMILDLMQDQGVDKTGLFGLSGGGMGAMYIGALDERISNMVINGYAWTTQGTMFSRHHCIDNYVSGMIRVGNCADILSVFAPKPQLILNGDKDFVFPAEGAMAVYSDVRKVYTKLNSADNIKAIIFPGAHETPEEIVIDWFKNNIS